VPPLDAGDDYFEHDADIGVIGRGSTVEGAFASAARAMFAIQSAPESVRSLVAIQIDFEEGDLELALVRWLNALLCASRERGIALGEFGIGRDGDRWRGWARGERWREGLERGTEVKGATLTGLSVSREAGKCEVRCVVDV